MVRSLMLILVTLVPLSPATQLCEVIAYMRKTVYSVHSPNLRANLRLIVFRDSTALTPSHGWFLKTTNAKHRCRMQEKHLRLTEEQGVRLTKSEHLHASYRRDREKWEKASTCTGPRI